MKNSEYSFKYYQLKSFEEFSQEEMIVIEKAKEACNRSYSPYSLFRVGSAAILDNGEIISAANQESEVYPSGMCAERVLLYNILSSFPNNKITTLVVYSTTAITPCTPCGACRQVIVDTQKRQKSKIRVVMCSSSEALIVEDSYSLLPFLFNL